jgi:hypothetical protein
VLRDTRALGFFWSAVDQAQWPTDAEAREEIESLLEGAYGDRRTEMVLIGRGMDEAALRQAFDECLLSDEEFKAGPDGWQHLADPFPQWVSRTE